MNRLTLLRRQLSLKAGRGTRITRMSQLTPDIEEAHRVAVSQGKDTYIDPRSGLMVFTALAAERRGKCCGRGCRHCPFGHFNVPDQERRKAPLPTKPTLLRASGTQKDLAGKELRILFWSGGKDSFLTLLKLMEDDPSNEVTLLTTFDLASGQIPEQNIPLNDVFDQSRALRKDLCVVPLVEGKDEYMKAVLGGLKVVETANTTTPPRSTRLYFGDLHLEDIRSWRETRFGEAGYRCAFPIFKVPYPELVRSMFGTAAQKYSARYYFSAMNSSNVGYSVGDEITQEVMEQRLLPGSSFDPFGECGEFHTVVRLE